MSNYMQQLQYAYRAFVKKGQSPEPKWYSHSEYYENILQS